MDQLIIESLERYYRKNLLRCLLIADDNNARVLRFDKKLDSKDRIYVLNKAWEKLTCNIMTHVATLKRTWNRLCNGAYANVRQIGTNGELESLARNM